MLSSRGISTSVLHGQVLTESSHFNYVCLSIIDALAACGSVLRVFKLDNRCSSTSSGVTSTVVISNSSLQRCRSHTASAHTVVSTVRTGCPTATVRVILLNGMLLNTTVHGRSPVRQCHVPGAINTGFFNFCCGFLSIVLYARAV